MLIGEIGSYLQAQGLGTLNLTTAAGTIYLENLPPEPDAVVMIRSTGGTESDVRLAYDNVTAQILVRGGADALAATQELAQGIYDALHGFIGQFVGGGLWIIACIGVSGGPAYIGADENDRPEYSLNFRLMVRNESRRLT